MLHTIENDYLKVTVSDHGAELTSVYDKAQDFERIWCADPAVWNRHAPVLFPFVGKVKDGAYRYNGNTYTMKTQHGFARDAEFTCIAETTDSITHKLVYSDETLEIYPFEFELLITHRFDAENPRLMHVTWTVKNLGSDEMLYSIGGHPGFQIPIEKNLKFEDYRIDFGEDPKPRRILFSEDCFVLEEDEAFALEEGRYLNLEHNLFDDDAIVLKEMPREVTLESAKGSKKITVAFPDMDYLGIWHWPHVEVDYVCIEPWSSLPSRKNVVEDLEKQADLLSLESGQEYTNTWSITIKEK